MINGAIMLVRNIDKAHLSSDAELQLRDPLAPILKRPGTAYIPEIQSKRKLKTAPVRPGAPPCGRLGREIEARSASSCCERPVRLRAARNMPPVISTSSC
jgi:hypothetical protein